MTYAELIAEIKLLSNRGDIDDKIAVALRLTTLRVHTLDFWWRDRVEALLMFGPSQEVVVDTSTDLTRFRQVDYLRYYDPTNGALGSFLTPVEPAEMFDDYNYVKEDRYYLAGTNLNIRFMYPSSGAALGYWQLPDTAAATYNSWIKDLLPDILVQGALAYIYNTTGKQEEARAINQMLGLEPAPANRAPGFTMVDQLRAIALRPDGHP